MSTVASSAFLGRFPEMLVAAAAEPVLIGMPDGRRFAFMSMREWDRLRGRKRKVFLTEDLPEEIVRRIAAAEPGRPTAESGPGWECFLAQEFAARFDEMTRMAQDREVLVVDDDRLAFVLMTQEAYARLSKVKAAG